MSSVTPQQRHTRAHRCPICDGADGDPRGKERRCSGFTSDGDEWVHCSREELAGAIPANGAGLFAHSMHGSCKCGQTHGAARTNGSTKEILATYDYTDERGTLLYQVVRFAPKDFRQRQPDGAGGWIWSLGDVRRVPYRLRELVEDDADRTVYIVEGEKDVEALERRGHPATCNPGGAGKWSAVADAVRKLLQGRDVIVIADRDDVGRKHAESIEASLRGVARAVRILECPVRKDVSDHFEAGGELDELVPIGTSAATPEWATKEGQAFLLRWPKLTAIDLATELPPIPWVCEPLAIAPGAVTIVGGAGFGGKTISMQAFLLAVASGRKAWGHYDVQIGRSVHVDYEQGRHLTQLRYQRLSRSMGINIRDLDGRLEAYCLPRARLDEKESEGELIKILDGARVAIVDAFRGAFPTAKENDSGVRSFLDMLQSVSERTGCAIVTIAHSRKMTDDVDIRSSLRGSGALFDAAQTVYMIDGISNEMRRISNTKDRLLGETRESFGLRVRDDVSPNPDLSDRKWGLVVEYAAPCEVQAEEMNQETSRETADDLRIAMNSARLTSLAGRIMAVMRVDSLMPVSSIAATLIGVASATEIKAVMTDLEVHGAIRREGSGAGLCYQRTA